MLLTTGLLCKAPGSRLWHRFLTGLNAANATCMDGREARGKDVLKALIPNHFSWQRHSDIEKKPREVFVFFSFLFK